MNLYADDLRERLFVEVYNAGKLEEKLKGVLHECREDLVLVYRLSGYDEHSKRDCDLVTEEQMERWGVDAETLKRDAWANTMETRPPIMIDMQDACYFMLHDKDGSMLYETLGECKENLWYFTIPAEITEGMIGRYWYCIGGMDGNLCFLKPFYLE